MVEDMYQQEETEEKEAFHAQTPTPCTNITTTTTNTTSATLTTTAPPPAASRSEIIMSNIADNDFSHLAINTQQHRFLKNQATEVSQSFIGTATANADIGSGAVKFGTTTTGDVSLTLGLRHTGNMPENNSALR